MKMAENIKLTAELKKYMTALKEETVKRSKAADMVNILRITKDSESEMDKLMNTLTIQESEPNPNGQNNNAWKTKGKEGGLKRNNMPKVSKAISNDLIEGPPCGKDFNEKEIEKHLEGHLPGVRVACEVCGVEMDESELEEHLQRSHAKTEKRCEKCPKTYNNNDHLKRHMWRAHTPTECNLCDSSLESRQDLKHHKENVHSVTKQIECKYAKDGTCIDGEECLFLHDENSNVEKPKHIINRENPLSNIKCQQCPKEYTTKFEVKRHEWRAHEQVDCRLCGQASESRQDLEIHKQNSHGITKQRNCKFWESGKCVDGVECLFSHDNQSNNDIREHIQKNHKGSTENNRQFYCKIGMKCTRMCGIAESGHKRVKDIPCKFGKACTRNICHFKHDIDQGFQGNQRHISKP